MLLSLIVLALDLNIPKISITSIRYSNLTQFIKLVYFISHIMYK